MGNSIAIGREFLLFRPGSPTPRFSFFLTLLSHEPGTSPGRGSLRWMLRFPDFLDGKHPAIDKVHPKDFQFADLSEFDELGNRGSPVCVLNGMSVGRVLSTGPSPRLHFDVLSFSHSDVMRGSFGDANHVRRVPDGNLSKRFGEKRHWFHEKLHRKSACSCSEFCPWMDRVHPEENSGKNSLNKP